MTRADIERFMHDVAAGKTAARLPTGPRGLARVTGGKETATLADSKTGRLVRPLSHAACDVLRSVWGIAGDLGYSEPTIGALIGHKGHSVTSRYMHAADAVLLASADAVANRTAELMGDAAQEAVVVPLRPSMGSAPS